MIPTTQLKNWINDQSIFLIVMIVINTIIGFIFLIIRSKIPSTWSEFDKFTNHGAETLLLIVALMGLYNLYCYYILSKRSQFTFMLQNIALVLSFVYIFPIYFAVINLKHLNSHHIKTFYKFEKND